MCIELCNTRGVFQATQRLTRNRKQMFHNIDFQNVAVKFQEIVTLDIQIGFEISK